MSYGKIGTGFYLLGLISMAVFIPLSNYGMSVTQFYLLAVWILVGVPMADINKMFPEKSLLPRLSSQIAVSFRYIGCNIRERFNTFLHNKTALVLSSLFLIHVLGLIHTADFDYAAKDLRTKLPLLLFPILLSSMKPLTRKQTDIVLWFYIASIVFGAIFSTEKYLSKDFLDVREISVFISHIRFCLSIVFSIFILAYFIVTRKYHISLKIIMMALILWFLWLTFVFESLIGFVLLTVIPSLIIIYFTIKKGNTTVKIIVFSLILVVFSIGSLKTFKIIKENLFPGKIDFSTLDKTTKLGNPYIHDTVNFPIEEGRYSGLYICESELEEEWGKISDIDFKDIDYQSIIRYLNSKNLRKDAEGLSQLTKEDIQHIENNIDNYNYIYNPGIMTRLSKMLVAYQRYKKTKDANGSSEFQRIEYIKASLNIIKDNLIFGVGTGDLPDAFENYYEESDSKLLPQYRHRSHNQYLSITVGLGIIGLLWFLFTLLYPIIFDKNSRNFLYVTFLLIMLLSMFTEDTIESQAGVTLFAFFNSFLLFNNTTDKNQTSCRRQKIQK